VDAKQAATPGIRVLAAFRDPLAGFTPGDEVKLIAVMRDTRYKTYLLTVLLSILAFNYVDRLALGLLLQDIKVDLNLSDTQLGFLNGIAFALFYSVLGIPIARWADRGNRVTIISLTTALWSVAVAACGLAGSFLQLLLIRIGVAVGEAGCLPPAHSLIADHFTRAERPRAVAQYMLGIPLSVIVGYFLAGWLNELYGWRITFVLLGLPGLFLGMLARLTLREPRRLQHSADTARPLEPPVPRAPMVSDQPTVKEVCLTLWASKAFGHLLLCFAIASFFGNGIAMWQPTFFVRSHGLQTGELGTWFMLIFGIGGFVGTYLGGEWAARHAVRNEPLQLKAMAVGYCSFGLIQALVYVVPNVYLAFGLMGLATLGGAMTTGPLFATIHTLVPERMRAMAIATIYLFANLIGMGLGPLAAGALSDILHPLAADQSLRYALLLLCPGYLWAAWHLWRSSRTVSSDLAAVRLTHRADDFVVNALAKN
jgi:MFS transporter, Spinster family, sphingosine-1-phosphate transporter